MSMVVLIYGCCFGVHAGKKLQSMANQYRLGNLQNEERSPYRDAIYLRLFGSNISIIPTTHIALEGNNTSHFINGGPRSVSSISARDNMSLSSLYPAIGGQTGAAPFVGSDYQRSGAVVGNSSNANSISSFNNGINTTTTGTRNDELCRDNSSFKRSRSPDPFTRDETSNQGSQIDGRFTRRRTLPPPIHPYQDNVNNMSSLPTTTFWDPFIMDEDTDVDAGLSTTTTTQSEINSSPGGPASFFEDHDSSHYNFPGLGFTIATQTIQFIHTGSGSQRSETVARSSSSYQNFISTSHELSIERDMLRVEVYIIS
jgi:hypothetical protein